MIKFDVYNRWTDEVQFTAEIEADKRASRSVKLGLAAKWGLKNKRDLIGANLIGADLSGADLIGADLRGANLIGANLIGANLIGANLNGANLRDANLRGANLRGANLIGANLIGADLNGANLRDAGLIGANLRGANLRYANLIGANLRGAKNLTIFVPIAFVGNELRQGYAQWKAGEKQVYVQLGCFWGTEKEALKEVGEKYGSRSSYCQMIRAACRIARELKVINPTEEMEGV